MTNTELMLKLVDHAREQGVNSTDHPEYIRIVNEWLEMLPRRPLIEAQWDTPGTFALTVLNGRIEKFLLIDGFIVANAQLMLDGHLEGIVEVPDMLTLAHHNALADIQNIVLARYQD